MAPDVHYVTDDQASGNSHGSPDQAKSELQLGNHPSNDQCVLSPDNGGNNGLKRDMSARQLILFALSGSIGAGLFVGSGQGLSAGGPASLFLNFLAVGCMVCCTMAALGEMATSYPVAGAFYDYSVRFVGGGWGFTMGWNFVLNWLVVLPFELTTIVAQIKFWAPEAPWVKVVIVLGLLALLALVAWRGVKWFGELEHWLGVCKAVAITVFICLAFAIVCAGVPGDPRGAVGARYWHNPGAFLNGFQGFLMIFRVSGMAYGGTEMLGLTAAECRRPHRILPLATKVVFFRIVVFYGVSLLMLGFTVPANSSELASTGHGAKYSPFVLAANMAGVPALAHLFNAMIVAALLSMANASIFASSRALQALCAKGMGPRLFATVNPRRGTPVNALRLAFGFGTLALITMAPGGGALFDWLLSLSGLSNYFTWLSICASHLRMRAAMGRQGRDPRDLIWRSPFGVWGSWVGVVICAVGIVTQVVNAVWPLHGHYDWQAALRDVLGIIFVAAVFGGYVAAQALSKDKGGDKKLLVPLDQIDLATGFRSQDYARAADDEVTRVEAEERQRLGYDTEWPWHKRLAFEAKRELKWPWFGKDKSSGMDPGQGVVAPVAIRSVRDA